MEKQEPQNIRFYNSRNYARQPIGEIRSAVFRVKVLADELSSEIMALEDFIKAEMNARNTEKLQVDVKIRYKTVKGCRFDTKAFKAANSELYDRPIDSWLLLWHSIYRPTDCLLFEACLKGDGSYAYYKGSRSQEE